MNQSLIDWQGSFESTSALAMLMLWLMFNYLSPMVNCDLQRLMNNNMLVRHLISLLSFFFLFTLIDSKANLVTTWIKTVVVYIVFVLLTKSKWYVVVPVLALLLIDQSLKRYKNEVKHEDTKKTVDKMRRFLNIAVIVIVFIGTFDYYLIQKKEYKNKFSFKIFFLGAKKKCKPSFPKIAREKIVKL